MGTVKIGSMPDTGALQAQLTLNVSTKADVLKVLSPPRGYGMARLPPDYAPRVLWFYEYMEVDPQLNVGLKTLVVIFDGEQYSGTFGFLQWKR
jgi:hypothetical protein